MMKVLLLLLPKKNGANDFVPITNLTDGTTINEDDAAVADGPSGKPLIVAGGAAGMDLTADGVVSVGASAALAGGAAHMRILTKLIN